jgi:hypothetical protein
MPAVGEINSSFRSSCAHVISTRSQDRNHSHRHRRGCACEHRSLPRRLSWRARANKNQRALSLRTPIDNNRTSSALAVMVSIMPVVTVTTAVIVTARSRVKTQKIEWIRQMRNNAVTQLVIIAAATTLLPALDALSSVIVVIVQPHATRSQMRPKSVGLAANRAHATNATRKLCFRIVGSRSIGVYQCAFSRRRPLSTKHGQKQLATDDPRTPAQAASNSRKYRRNAHITTTTLTANNAQTNCAMPDKFNKRSTSTNKKSIEKQSSPCFFCVAYPVWLSTQTSNADKTKIIANERLRRDARAHTQHEKRC